MAGHQSVKSSWMLIPESALPNLQKVSYSKAKGITGSLCFLRDFVLGLYSILTARSSYVCTSEIRGVPLCVPYTFFQNTISGWAVDAQNVVDACFHDLEQSYS